jgi:hypothetical protein
VSERQRRTSGRQSRRRERERERTTKASRSRDVKTRLPRGTGASELTEFRVKFESVQRDSRGAPAEGPPAPPPG